MHPHVEVRRHGETVAHPIDAHWPAAPTAPPPSVAQEADPSRAPAGRRVRVPLRRIAYARSGDKGAHANIGVAARSAVAFEALREALTAERVAGFFGELVAGPVERYEIRGLRAFNFFLRDALGGGGTVSLRTDHQGKTLAQGLLGLEIEVAESVVKETPSNGEG